MIDGHKIIGLCTCRIQDEECYKFIAAMNGYLIEKGLAKTKELKKAIESFDISFIEYQKLESNENAATLYKFEYYLFDQPGMMSTVNKYRKMI